MLVIDSVLSVGKHCVSQALLEQLYIVTFFKGCMVLQWNIRLCTQLWIKYLTESSSLLIICDMMTIYDCRTHERISLHCCFLTFFYYLFAHVAHNIIFKISWPFSAIFNAIVDWVIFILCSFFFLVIYGILILHLRKVISWKACIFNYSCSFFSDFGVSSSF